MTILWLRSSMRVGTIIFYLEGRILSCHSSYLKRKDSLHQHDAQSPIDSIFSLLSVDDSSSLCPEDIALKDPMRACPERLLIITGKHKPPQQYGLSRSKLEFLNYIHNISHTNNHLYSTLLVTPLPLCCRGLEKYIYIK